jgi:hypothetical protein
MKKSKPLPLQNLNIYFHMSFIKKITPILNLNISKNTLILTPLKSDHPLFKMMLNFSLFKEIKSKIHSIDSNPPLLCNLETLEISLIIPTLYNNQKHIDLKEASLILIPIMKTLLAKMSSSKSIKNSIKPQTLIPITKIKISPIPKYPKSILIHLNLPPLNKSHNFNELKKFFFFQKKNIYQIYKIFFY